MKERPWIKSLGLRLSLFMIMSVLIAVPAAASTTTQSVTYDTTVQSSMTQTSNYETCISLLIADSYQLYGGQYHLINPQIWDYNPNYPSASQRNEAVGKYAILNGSINEGTITQAQRNQMLQRTSAMMIQVKSGMTCEAYSVPGNSYESYAFKFPCDMYFATTTYNISYNYSGTKPSGAPSIIPENGLTAGQTATVKANPSLAGYTFTGWKSSAVNVSGAGATFGMPAMDVVFTGSWSPRTDTHYNVDFYQQPINGDEYIKLDADTQTGTGTTDTKIVDNLDMIALDTKYPHYHLTATSKANTTVIDGAGTSTLKLYYDLDTANVSYSYSGDTDTTPPELPAPANYRYGQTVTLAADPLLTGYTFSGWKTPDKTITDGTFTMLDNPVILTGTWTPRPDTPYTVEYFQQNVNDNNYTKLDSDTVAGTGTTGATIIGADKTYPGFTMTPASSNALANTKIHSTGNTVLKLYYDRNINYVTYAYASDTDVPPAALPGEESFRYGQTVTLAMAPSLTGYDFEGWKTTNATVAGGTFTMPDFPVALTGTWVPRSDTAFVVEYYQQNLENHDYTKVAADTYTGEGTTGAPIPQAHKEYEGYTETGPSVAAETATKIASNGSTILKLYYDRNSYAVSYAYSSGHIDGEPSCPAEQHFQYGATVTVEPAFSELTGYHFDGWNSNDVSLSSGTFTMPAKAVSITGAWLPNSDTPYKVEIYQQNLEDHEYSLVDTVDGHGTTGAAAPEVVKPHPGFTMTTASAAEAGTTVIAPDGSTFLRLYYDRNSYSVTYAYAGDTPLNAPALPKTTTYKFGETVTLAVSPEWTGPEKFEGWQTTDVILAPTFSMPENKVTITGVWNLKSTDSNNGNEGGTSYLAILVTDKNAQSNIVPDSQNKITLPEGPSKDGYTFVGWTESHGSNVEYQAGDSITLTKSITFFAVYAKKDGAFIYGYRDGTFRPEDNLTTYQTQLMLARLMGTPEPDVATNTKKAISRKDFLIAVEQSTATALINDNVIDTAAEKGWIQGYANGTMQENDNITRAQAVVILNRAFNRSNVQPDNAISYTDLPKNYWAHDQIIAASSGIKE